MILVDPQAAHLVAGYDRLRETGHALRSRLRHPLLAAYATRRAAYDRARQEQRRRQSQLAPWLAGAGLLAAILLLGSLLLPASIGVWRALVGVGGVGIALLAGGALLWVAVLSVPNPPVHPLHPRPGLAGVLRTLPADLRAAWRRGLEIGLPPMAYEGAWGEYQFIHQLQSLGLQPSYLVYRLRQRQGDDVDVLVLAASGVWVFEVKYWSGRITWRHGVWHRTKTYHGQGGQLVTEEKDVGEPPDRQWKRMAADVAGTLRRREQALVARLPALCDVRGGVVFAHPDAELDIDPACPVSWGTIRYWTQELASALPQLGLDERTLLRSLDSLLARHRDITGEPANRSLDAYACDLIRRAEERLTGSRAGP